MLDYPVLLILPAALAYAAVMDIFTMTIPNRISLALIGLFPVAAFVAGLPMYTVLMHLAAFAIVLAFGIALFSAGLLGGGDAKLLATSTLWIGMQPLVPFVAYVAICGGVLALLFMTLRAVPLAHLSLPAWAARLHKSGNGIPYGLAICAGGLLIYPQTEIFKALIA